MPIVIIIEKENIKELKIDDISELYKKCKFKKIEGFNEIHQWDLDKKKVKLFGKCSGKNNSKNSYVFPGISTIIYGSCALVSLENNKYVDLSINEWNKFLNGNNSIESSKTNFTEKDKEKEKEKEKENDEENILNEKLSKNDIDSDEEKEDKENDNDNDNDNDELDDMELSCDEDNYEKETSDIELEEDKENNELNEDEKYFSGSELSADIYIYSSEED